MQTTDVTATDRIRHVLADAMAECARILHEKCNRSEREEVFKALRWRFSRTTTNELTKSYDIFPDISQPVPDGLRQRIHGIPAEYNSQHRSGLYLEDKQDAIVELPELDQIGGSL